MLILFVGAEGILGVAESHRSNKIGGFVVGSGGTESAARRTHKLCSGVALVEVSIGKDPPLPKVGFGKLGKTHEVARLTMNVRLAEKEESERTYARIAWMSRILNEKLSV